jgi:hypothetical protein
MMAFIRRELRHQLHLYARKGGKKSRRRQVERIEIFVEWCHRPAEQIGRRQVHEFFEAHQFAPTTARDYYYAVCKLWTLLGRVGKPPLPPILRE